MPILNAFFIVVTSIENPSLVMVENSFNICAFQYFNKKVIL